jgi:hypothetical protein
MKVEKFLTLVKCLTGTEVKHISETDKACLDKLLSNDDKNIDCSQLNELLLLVNKDRVALPFFQHFFTLECRVADIAVGVERFQKTAMLRFGNFIWAYRRLSAIKEAKTFLAELGEYGIKPEEEVKRFRERQAKLLEIEGVDRESTVLLGYLSAVDIAQDHERCLFLKRVADSLGSKANLQSLKDAVAKNATPHARRDLAGIIDKIVEIKKTNSIAKIKTFINSSAKTFQSNTRQFEAILSQGRRNQEIYLTWDHMDVYFATSMRKPWEFRDLFDFIQKLMSTERLRKLDLRYFDPTQSYTSNRVNKGLLEALMLKRARCTVYSVQDTDTLGKDSELAATLAQGKPVIAYIPEVDVDDRAAQLEKEEPITIFERLRFVGYADESFGESFNVGDFDVATLSDSRIWRSVPDADATEAIRIRGAKAIPNLCRKIAAAEKRIYDRRAKALLSAHPLAIQVNLDTGVANGVLVVRDIESCSKLLLKVLTRAMDFEVEEDDDLWYLRERASKSVYRVVTKDQRLNNCFWNFYLR